SGLLSPDQQAPGQGAAPSLPPPRLPNSGHSGSAGWRTGEGSPRSLRRQPRLLLRYPGVGLAGSRLLHREGRDRQLALLLLAREAAAVGVRGQAALANQRAKR